MATKKSLKKSRQPGRFSVRAASLKRRALKLKKSVPKLTVRTKKIALAILAFAGIQLALLGVYWHFYQTTILSFQTTPVVVSDSQLRGPLPAQLEISQLGITLPVTGSSITNGVWETSETTISHLTTSARPKENGNIVMYGHNRPHLLRRLPSAKVGQLIRLTTTDNQIFTYQITEIATISPSEVGAVLPTDHEVLTLYTCVGWFDSQRLVVKAYPVVLENTNPHSGWQSVS